MPSIGPPQGSVVKIQNEKLHSIISSLVRAGDWLLGRFPTSRLRGKHKLLLQIYVEIERARLTRKLALMKEDEGKVKEAAEILQEVAVVSAMHQGPSKLEPSRFLILKLMQAFQLAEFPNAKSERNQTELQTRGLLLRPSQ